MACNGRLDPRTRKQHAVCLLPMSGTTAAAQPSKLKSKATCINSLTPSDCPLSLKVLRSIIPFACCLTADRKFRTLSRVVKMPGQRPVVFPIDLHSPRGFPCPQGNTRTRRFYAAVPSLRAAVCCITDNTTQETPAGLHIPYSFRLYLELICPAFTISTCTGHYSE